MQNIEFINEKLDKVKDLAASKNIQIKYFQKDDDYLDRLTGYKNHQGVVLKTLQRDYKKLKTNKSIFEIFKKDKGNFIILLDGIIDPQNVGSILKTAYFYNIDFVFLNNKNKPNLTPSISQVSSGASESQELNTIKNVKEFILGKNRFIIFIIIRGK